VKIRWTRRALTDLQRIADRIAIDNPRAADQLAAEVRRHVSQLQQHPLIGRAGAHDDTRELVVHRNYLLTYRLRLDEVQILQLWHVARHLARSRPGSR
jgi:addiction module RelE/StbE family toxin